MTSRSPGDGEPTISPLFPEAVEAAIEVRTRLAAPGLKLVLITDALTLQKPKTRAAVDRMMANGGEIWAKLDAGTDEYFRLVCRGECRSRGRLPTFWRSRRPTRS